MRIRVKTYLLKEQKVFMICFQKVLLLYFFSFSCYAQNFQQDELKNGLEQQSINDSILIGLLLEGVEANHLINKDSIFRYCEHLLIEAQQQNNPLMLAKANKLMGIYWHNNQPSESLDFFKQALDIYKEEGNKEEIVSINNMIAKTYCLMEDYDKQLVHLKRALQNVLNLNNKDLEIDILYNISEAYLSVNNYELAEDYALMTIQESRNYDHLMLDQVNHTLAKIEFRKGNYRHSIQLSREVMIRAHEQGKVQMEMACMLNISNCLIELKQYREARDMLNKCQTIVNANQTLSNDYELLKLVAKLDFLTGNYYSAFNKQRQLEQLTSKNNSLEQLQKASIKAKQAELQHLNMRFSHLQASHQELRKKAIKLNSVLIAICLFAFMGCAVLIWLRQPFKKLKLDKETLLKKHTVIDKKKTKISGKHQVLINKNDLLKKTNQDIIVSDRSKTELFKAMSHDLQMPIVRLQQNLSDLMVSDMNETLFRQATNELTNMVGGISLLLENLLQWSKYQSQGIIAKPQYTEITASVNDAIGQQKYSAAEKKVSVFNTLKNSIFVYADEEMVKSTLKAILQNIIKLSNSNAAITISGEKDIQNGWLHINYSGKMPLKQMFLQQSQADSYGAETSELGKSICLGWMLCRTLMKANHGNIQIEDISTGSFNIVLYFPLEETESKVKV